jgi:hypothetical protein
MPSFYLGPGPSEPKWYEKYDARRDRAQPRRLQTCFHESAHACLYRSHDIEVIDLVALRTAANPDWLAFCRTRHRGPIPPQIAATCSLAGQAADLRFFGGEPDLGSSDRLEAREEAAKLDPINPDLAFDRAWSDACRLVEFHKDAISKVAHALHEHRALPPADLDELLAGTTVETHRRAVQRIGAILKGADRGAARVGTIQTRRTVALPPRGDGLMRRVDGWIGGSPRRA